MDRITLLLLDGLDVLLRYGPHGLAAAMGLAGWSLYRIAHRHPTP